MDEFLPVGPIALFLSLSLLSGCGGTSRTNAPVSNPGQLIAANLNLIFVVSPDVAYQTSGDVDPRTANLTIRAASVASNCDVPSKAGAGDKERQRNLRARAHDPFATRPVILGGARAIQQFALMNQTTLSSDLVGGTPYSGQNSPINASYAPGSVPGGVLRQASTAPLAKVLISMTTAAATKFCCRGSSREMSHAFTFRAGEATSSLLANINTLEGYNLLLPAAYRGSNYIYAI